MGRTRLPVPEVLEGPDLSSMEKNVNSSAFEFIKYADNQINKYSRLILVVKDRFKFDDYALVASRGRVNRFFMYFLPYGWFFDRKFGH
jgi:hypothetical protein